MAKQKQPVQKKGGPKTKQAARPAASKQTKAARKQSAERTKPASKVAGAEAGMKKKRTSEPAKPSTAKTKAPKKTQAAKTTPKAAAKAGQTIGKSAKTATKAAGKTARKAAGAVGKAAGKVTAKATKTAATSTRAVAAKAAAQADVQTAKTRASGKAASAKVTAASSQGSKPTTSALKKIGKLVKPLPPRSAGNGQVAGGVLQAARSVASRTNKFVEVESTRKSHLTAEELAEFRQVLLDKRRELVEDMVNLEDEARRTGSEGNSGGSAMPIHMADIGSDTWEQEFTLGLIEKERTIVREIDEALDRIEKKTFGTCLATGKAISKARLRVKPWAKYCIEYARKQELGLV